MAIQIDSVSNEKIKYLIKLASSSKFRKENGEFFLEGLRLCCDAAVSETEITAVFYTQKAFEKSESEIEKICSKAESSFLISEAVSQKISQTPSSQGVFCKVKIKSQTETEIDFSKKYIALDGVQNPDNLGAVSRTAEALGISGIIIGGGCDIYNPKAQRSSMGSLFRLPVLKTQNLSEFLLKLQQNGMKIYATTPESDALKITEADMNGGTVCVIGNEANGVSEEVFAVSEKITIPMLGRAESLNAGVAAAITMWEMLRK